MAGLMQRLGQLGGEQSGINRGTQSGMGKGQGMTSQQEAEYKRPAGQQGGVPESSKKLTQEAKNGEEYSRLLGDLDRISKEMQEVVTDLNQGEVNPETISKQDRILSRLLDASRSTRERDYEKRRRSETGKDVAGKNPAEI